MNTLAIRVKTPARVNIIGEHTDYNGGFVLPMSTAIFTSVTARPREDQIVQVRSNSVGETCSFDLNDIRRVETVTWIEYVKGVASELQQSGIRLRGTDLEIDSDIPLGAGLSSSASLELSVAKALLAIAGENVVDSEIATLCQRAEQNYAGVHCGIMDQYTLACAQKGHAILLDCRSMEVEQMLLPKQVGFILTDSGARHSLAEGAYNNRADECTAAVALLASREPGFQQLRDLNAEMLEAKRTKLGDLLFRRCRHVVTENRRVQSAAQALRIGDLTQLGALLDTCHDSLRDDFEVSCNELDALVAAANSSEFVLGSRMVGAGFGGCVLSVCNVENIAAASREIRDQYAVVSGREPWQHLVAAAAPAQLVNNV